MSFTYRNVKGSELSYAELDENFQTVERLHDATLEAKEGALAAAFTAIAISNFKGEWQELSGFLAFPASVVTSGNFYALLNDLPDVTLAEPGVSPAWQLIPLGGLPEDFSELTSAAEIGGTELIALSGGFKSTLSAIFAWFKNQANSWSALQTFTDLRETMVAANTGSAYTVSLANGTLFNLTLTGNCTYTFPAATSGKQFTLLQKQDATGARIVTWPASVRWAGGTAPTITATASKTDVISFISDGTYWLGFVGGLNFTRA